MKIFLSWSGPHSRRVAEQLYDWLPRCIQLLRPWLSAEDIDAGARWSPEIARELQDNGYGVLCLTHENLSAPWILFEAGALSKIVDSSRVCPFLLDVPPTDLKGPLAQFQAQIADREGTLRLLKSINRALGAKGLTEDALLETFDVWWPRLDGALTSIREQAKAAVPALPSRSTQDIMTELLELARAQDRRAQEQAKRDQAQRERSRLLRESLVSDLELSGQPSIGARRIPRSPGATGLLPGEQVLHARFGRGTVVENGTVAGEEAADIDFGEHGTKKILVRYGHLRRVPPDADPPSEGLPTT